MEINKLGIKTVNSVTKEQQGAKTDGGKNLYWRQKMGVGNIFFFFFWP